MTQTQVFILGLFCAFLLSEIIERIIKRFTKKDKVVRRLNDLVRQIEQDKAEFQMRMDELRKQAGDDCTKP